MSHEPRTFTGDALGLRVTVVEDGSGTGGSLARAEISAAAGGNGGPPHIHLSQEERFTVHDGLLLVRRRGERLLQKYPDEFLYLPPIPVSIRRMLAHPLAWLGGRSP